MKGNNMTNELVSVIIPVYNTAPYLERCLNSVTANTYRNLEIICVDDGSTDNSLAVLQHLADSDCRIQIVTKENGGVSSARNCGLEQATGAYICYLDSDDWIHKDFFITLLQIASAYPFDVTVAGRKYASDMDYSEIDQDIVTEIPVHTADSIKAQKIGHLRTFVTGRLYKHNVVRGLLFLDAPSGEDSAYNAMLVSNTDTVAFAYIDEPLYYYYQGRSDSIVKSSSVDTYRLQAQWYLDHMDLFIRTDYAVNHAFKSAFLYRYIGSFDNTAKDVKQQSKALLKKCIQYLNNNKTIPISTRFFLLVFSMFPSLYRLQLLLRDPTYRNIEKARTGAA